MVFREFWVRRKIKQLAAVLFAVSILASQALAESELHIIAACDTAHPDFGEAFEINLLRIKSVFLDHVATDRLRITELRSRDDDPLTKKKLQAAIRGVSVNPDDTLLVYLACGSPADGEQGQSFQFSGNEEVFTRRSIRHSVTSRNVRLGGLLTDPCVEYSILTTPMTAISAIGPANSKTKPLFRHLFFTSTGLLDWSACAPDQFALYANNYRDIRQEDADGLTKKWVLAQRHYDGISGEFAFNFGSMYIQRMDAPRYAARGGLFTESFAKTLSKHADDQLTWAEFKLLTQKELTTSFIRESSGGLVFVNDKWVPQKRQSITVHSSPD